MPHVETIGSVVGLPAALAGRASSSQGRPGDGSVFLGDSITAGDNDNPNQGIGMSWALVACMASGQRIKYVYNAGVPGNTSTQMLARVQTDVIARSPQTCFVMAGSNDIAGGVSLSVYQSNMRAIISALRSASITPVLLTLPPSNTTSFHAAISSWNHWIRRYATSEGIALIDAHAVWVDPATAGNYLAAYVKADGIHPNSLGHAALGQHIASVAATMFPWGGPRLLDANLDPNNMLPAGLFLNDATSDGIAEPWYPYWAKPAGCTLSLVTDPLVKGKMQRFSHVAVASTMGLYQPIPNTKFSVGDRVLFTGVVTSDGGVMAQVQLTFANGTPFTITRPLGPFTVPITRGVILQEVVVPAGTTSIDVLLTVGAGTGVVEFGQVSMFNLTRMGVL